MLSGTSRRIFLLSRRFFMGINEVKEKFKEMPRGMNLDQAIFEAERCLLCHDAPCSKACPADTQPGEFIRKLRFRNLTGAMRTIKTNNILGGACGVLCPTAELCEKECSARMASDENTSGSDRPVRIGDLQRFLVEHGRDIGFQPLSVDDEGVNGKVAVVGSGPSGLSCAAELAKKGYKVTIFEELAEPGGVLRYGVVPFRCDSDFVEKEINDVRSLGVEIQCNTPIKGDSAVENLLKDGFDAVFMGPGLWDAHTLKENASGIKGRYTSVDFLAALRDERFDGIIEEFRGKTVAVIGGGSVAMDCVEAAARLETEDVYLVYRRSFTQMPAEEVERIDALQSGVNFLLLHQPVDYITDDQNQLKGLKIVRTRLGKPDESGRRRPLEIEGTEWDMPVDIVIVAIGNTAPEDSPEWYPNIELDDNRLVVTEGESVATSVPGIFAGGDIVRGPALVVEAVQDGKKAAASIDEFIRNKGK
jgi:NADPH-dependent glutamate synthase beta subunit-like oxidoreductase